MIVVIDAGAVVEQGTHEQLLVAGGRYHGLWTAFTHMSAPGGMPA